MRERQPTGNPNYRISYVTYDYVCVLCGVALAGLVLKMW